MKIIHLIVDLLRFPRYRSAKESQHAAKFQETLMTKARIRVYIEVIVSFQENYNTPQEHTPSNPLGQLWRESHYSLLVKV